MTLLRLLLGLVTVLVGTTFLYEAVSDHLRAPACARLVIGGAGGLLLAVGVAVLAGWLP